MNQSEFRKDPVSNEWILISPGRLKYHHKHPTKSYLSRTKRHHTPKTKCPFEKPFDNISERIILGYGRHYDRDPRSFPKSDPRWEILVLQNRYPIVAEHKSQAPIRKEKKGIYETVEGVGHADIVLTRDHNMNFPRLDEWAAHTVFRAFRDRYRMLQKEPEVRYVSIFHNWGPGAGASVYHPHYQVIGIPVVPPDVARTIEGSRSYFNSHKRCVHCDMIKEEKKRASRIIYENSDAIAFAPFVSRNPFEIRVFPRQHLAYFEDTPESIMCSVSLALQSALKKIEKKLGDPDYIFFIHTAPLFQKSKHSHYHWHIEVYPKLSMRAGFEFGTGVEVNLFKPEFVAKVLKS